MIKIRGDISELFSLFHSTVRLIADGCVGGAGSHLVLCARRTASGCLSQPRSYWPAWTSAWTHRRGWGLGWRSRPRRRCNRTRRCRWTWLELCWWLRDKPHKQFTAVFMTWSRRGKLSALGGNSSSSFELAKRWHYCYTLHTGDEWNLPLSGEAITRWPFFSKYYHLFTPILPSLKDV